MTTVNNATYLFTPPQRDAVIELAKAYAAYHATIGMGRRRVPTRVVKHLVEAQETLGVELVSNQGLRAMLDARAEAA